MDRIRRIIRALLVAIVASGAPAALAAPGPFLPVLCWHDIRDATGLERASSIDTTTVTTRDLVAQFELIKLLGYTPISLAHWQAAREGRAALPPKPVILTFDDGFKSLYTRVYPLLKLYRYPAIASIVSEWMESPAAAADVSSGAETGAVSGADAGGARNERLKASELVSWQELREMSESGLLEIASHSHALHSGLVANPQGSEQPAALTRLFSDGVYETDQDYRARLFADLDLSRKILRHHLGGEVQTLVWPYGEYSDVALDEARRAGFSSAFGLSSGVNTLSTELMTLKRTQVLGHHSLADLVRNLQSPDVGYAKSLGTLRTLSISLDEVFDPVVERQEVRLAILVDLVRRLGVNTVVVRAWSDQPEADGTLPVYFPSAHRPLKSDLLNRASARLRHGAGVQVWVEWNLATSTQGAELTDLAAFDDLGKQVMVTGVVIRLPAAALDDRRSEPQRVRVRLAKALGWRADLATAISIETGASVVAANAPQGTVDTALRAALDETGADFVLIRGLPARSLPTANRRSGLVTAAAQHGGDELVDRLILEAQAPLDDEPPAQIERTVSARIESIDELLGSGLRHIGYQQLRTNELADQLDRLAPRLSTATLRRPGP